MLGVKNAPEVFFPVIGLFVLPVDLHSLNKPQISARSSSPRRIASEAASGNSQSSSSAPIPSSIFCAESILMFSILLKDSNLGRH